jgi:hypothetical protein
MIKALISGIAIYTSDFALTEERREVARTLKERWLSLPWRPLQKSKTVIEMRPHPGAILMNVNGEPALIMHPMTFATFKEQFRGDYATVQDQVLPLQRRVALDDQHA